MSDAPQNGPKRVLETGLAVVHEDEIIYPAAGSEAEAELALDDRESAVVVYFPVEVEVRLVEQDAAAMRGIAEDVLHDLAKALATKA